MNRTSMLAIVSLGTSMVCATPGPAQARDLGMSYDFLGVQPQSAEVIGRDGAYSARVGDDVLWVYGDTFVTGEAMLSSSAAVGRADDPLAFQDFVSADGQPRQLIPYTRAEKRYNATGKLDDRIAL